MGVKTQFDFAVRWRTIKLKSVESGRRKRTRLGVGMALVLVVGIMGGFPWYYSGMLQNRSQAINLEIAKYKDVENLLQKEEELKTKIKVKEQELSQIKASEQHPRVILEQLGQLLPAGSVINQFVLAEDNTLSIRVSVPGPLDVARLWVSLRNSGLAVSDINTVSLTNEPKVLSLQFKLN